MIQNICIKGEKKKKSNSLPAAMSQGQMFFLLPPVSSKFCSSITNDVRLKASSCFPPPFCSTIPNYKGYGFLTKYRTQDT